MKLKKIVGLIMFKMIMNIMKQRGDLWKLKKWLKKSKLMRSKGHLIGGDHVASGCVADLRHVFSLSAVLEQAGEEGFDDVLLMYNYMNFVQDTNLAKLRY